MVEVLYFEKHQKQMSQQQRRNKLIDIYHADQLNLHHLQMLRLIVNTSDFTILEDIEPLIKKHVLYLLRQRYEIICQQLQNELKLLLQAIIEMINRFMKKTRSILFSFYVKLIQQFERITKHTFMKANKQNQNFMITENKKRTQYIEKNKLFIEYLQEQNETQKEKINKKIGQIFPKKGWKNLFFLIEMNKKLNNDSINSIQKVQIYDICHNPKNYLCCSKFFYEGEDINDYSIDSYNDIQIVQSSDKININLLREIVISFLNSNIGGLLFFDCHQIGMKSCAIGRVLSQLQKQKIQQRIVSYLQCISPQVKPNKNFKFSWIPVAQNILTKIEQLKFIKGRYILRLQVVPTNLSITYHFSINYNQFFYYRQKITNKMLESNQIHKFIVNKFNKNQIKELKYIDHKHLIVQAGHKIYQESKQQPILDLVSKSILFKHISLIIIEDYKIDLIKQLFQKQNIEFSIHQSFPEYNFRLSPTTLILHHNKELQHILKILKQSNLTYGKYQKQIMMIGATKYLQCSYIDDVSMFNVKNFIYTDHNQQLTYEVVWKSSDPKPYLYIKLETVLAAIKAYLLIDNFSYRVRFIKQTINTSI